MISEQISPQPDLRQDYFDTQLQLRMVDKIRSWYYIIFAGIIIIYLVRIEYNNSLSGSFYDKNILRLGQIHSGRHH